MTALLAVICALNVGAVVLAWLALCRWRIRRRTRRLDALDKGSQLETTGIHHIDARDEVTKPHRRCT